MVDQWLYQQLMEINSKVTTVLSRLEDLKDCVDDHEARLRNLEERPCGATGVKDKWKYGGIGAGSGAGIAAAAYVLLEIIKSFGG